MWHINAGKFEYDEDGQLTENIKYSDCAENHDQLREMVLYGKGYPFLNVERVEGGKVTDIMDGYDLIRIMGWK